jgi:hypothetical protein
MRSMSMLQLLGGVAIAGAVAAGSTALTGHGLTRTAGANATDDKFVGGPITQTLPGGANIDSITYGYTDATNTKINQIAVAVTGAANQYLSLKPNGGTLSGSPLADEWVCTGPTATSAYSAGTVKIRLDATPQTVTCNPADSTSTPTAHATAGRFYAGLSTLDVTVSAT